MTDPIADLFTRIRNMNRLRRKTVAVPYSRMKEQILNAIRREGFIEGYDVEGEGVGRTLRVTLKYGPEGEPVIGSIDRVSTPGRRVYRGRKELKPVLRGMGISVLSTPKGILTDREARAQGIGGEVLGTLC